MSGLSAAGPTPALVTQRGARRLPRLPLWLMAAAYVLPGILGRDPWRGADMAAFGQMVAIAEGRTSWWAPTLGGVAADAAVLPHALGAAFVAAFSVLLPAVSPAFAARLPFALLLGVTLALVWYTTFHLARTDAAQPVPFAFGGEAEPVDYARALADGAVLATMATLGLLQLGHETTPELAQLAGTGLFLYALAAAPYRTTRPRLAVMVALAALAASGAPAIAAALGAAGTLVCRRSDYPQVRRFGLWVGAGTLLAATLAVGLDAWRWRVTVPAADTLPSIARQWLWFLWPAWLLGVWTLWRWRRQLGRRHISVPAVVVGVGLAANVAMGGSDRALLLALPGAAVLAAFALPTLARSTSAAIDWFSMCFFSAAAIAMWVVYSAMQTGVPAKPLANVMKLAPGFAPQFSALALALAAMATLAWLWLLRWRTGRHREAVWTSMVLPAGGVALCWLLLMTLGLPPLDYARSPRPWVERIAALVPRESCIAAPGLAPATVAALEHFGRWRVDARVDARVARRDGLRVPDDTPPIPCRYLVRVTRQGALPPPPDGYALLATVRRPTDRAELTGVYRRAPGPAGSD